MPMITSDHKTALDALTDWWEGAGVHVDRKEIEKLIRNANQAAPVTQLHGGGTTARKKAEPDHVAKAKALAGAADTLEALQDALTRFDGCELKMLAQHTVFADGAVDADVMVIGEGPGRDEDEQGIPFVGKAGHLLDRMLASIGLSRETNAYITNVNFWRPPGNRNPTDDELAMCRPFVDRHIALKKPKLIIVTGAVPAKALLDVSDGIMKLRGKKYDFTLPDSAQNVPLFPIFHPAYLLRRPAEKARAWQDLQQILLEMKKLGIAPDKRP